MLEEFCRAICDEQSQSKPVRAGRLEAVKRFKDILQMLRSHADPGIVNLNSDARTVAASEKNPSPLSRKLHRVSHEVADDACQQDWLTRDYRPSLNDVEPNTFLGGKFCDIPPDR